MIEAHHGDATRARARIQDALARLTVTHGPVEVEWAATGYEVTFLQMRPYRRPGRARLGAVSQSEIGLQLGWHWDAAHNPLPLSPAQAGLVALVDRVCDTGLRQQTLRGYLFYSHAPRPAGTTRRAPTSLTEALAALRALADARLAPRGGDSVSLDEALDTFLAIYQPLFGVVQPAARAARKPLTDFLQRHGFDPTPLLPRLLAGVPSAARERAELARALAAGDRSGRAGCRARRLPRALRRRVALLGRGRADLARDPRRAGGRLPRWIGVARRHPSPDDDWRAAADAVRAALPAPARAGVERPPDRGAIGGRRRRGRRCALRAGAGARAARAAPRRVAPRRPRPARPGRRNLLAPAQSGPPRSPRWTDPHARGGRPLGRRRPRRRRRGAQTPPRSPTPAERPTCQGWSGDARARAASASAGSRSGTTRRRMGPRTSVPSRP